MISLHRMDGVRVYLSPSYKRILGEEPEAHRGGVHPDDRKIVEEAWDKVRKGEPANVTYRHRAGAEWKWLEATSSRISYQGQHYVLSVIRDVTERHRFEEQV